MSFNKKGCPEKVNGINLAGTVVEQPESIINCNSCGIPIGVKKGPINLIAGKTTVSLGVNNQNNLCEKCKCLKK